MHFPVIVGPFVWYIYGKDRLKSAGAPFGFNNLLICLWENPKTLISMISGFLDLYLAPKTNFLSLETPVYLKQIKKNPGTLLKHIVFMNKDGNPKFLKCS